MPTVRRLDNQVVMAFDQRVHITPQGVARLDGTTYEKPVMDAKSCYMPVFGKVMANRKVRYARLTGGDVDNTRPLATLETWISDLWIDEDDEATINVDAMGAYGDIIAKALSRRRDQLKLDALDGTTTDSYGASPANIQTAVANAFTPDELAKVHTALAENAVPVNQQDVTFVARETLYTNLATDDKAASSDFITGQVTRTGMVPPLHGMRIVLMENRDEGGVKQVGGKNVGYAYHRNALGYARGTIGGRDIRTDITWNDEYQMWHLVGKFNAACIRVDNRMIVRLVSA